MGSTAPAAIPNLRHDKLIASKNSSPTDTDSWTSRQLRDALVGFRHDFIFLGGHYSAGSALAADGDITKQLTSREIAGSPADFLNSVIVGAGCHVAYDMVNADSIPWINLEPDWSEAFAMHRAAVVIGGTGYQYGDTDFVEYSDRLYVEFFKQLLRGSGAVSLGQALVAAKRQYLLETTVPRGTHEKSLLETVLYGLPMWSVNFPGGRGGSAPGIIPAALNPVPYTSDPGRTLGLAFADVAVTGINLAEMFVSGKIYKPDAAPVDITASYLINNESSGLTAVSSNPGEPVLPLVTRDVTASGTVLRGVGFRSGTYSDTAGITQLSGAPATETRGLSVPLKTDVFFPTQPWSVNYYDALCGIGNDRTLLMLTPAQYRSDPVQDTVGTRRAFTEMGFRLFYSANTTVYGANVPAFAAPPSISGVEANILGNTVQFKAHAVGDPSAGMQAVWVTYSDATVVAGQWQSLDLTQDPADSTLWVGTLLVGDPKNLRFIVQAVNGVGLVRMDANSGRYYQPVSAPPAATTLTFDPPPPSSAPYGATIQLSATLRSAGTAVPGQTVSFGLGPLRASATTGEDGKASTSLLLLTKPDSYPLQVSFGGTSTLSASADNAQFTVTKRATRIQMTQLKPDPNLDFSATLTDDNGRPLNERGLFFVVNNKRSGVIMQVKHVITDGTGRAALGAVAVPADLYEIRTFFNGVIPLAGTVTSPTSTTSLSDDLYNSSFYSMDADYKGWGCTVAYQGDTQAVAPATVRLEALVKPIIDATHQPPGPLDLTLAVVKYTVTAAAGGSEIAQLTAAVGPDGVSWAPLQGLSAGNYQITLTVVSGSFFIEGTPPVVPLTVTMPPPEAGQDFFEVAMDGQASVRLIKLLANDVDLAGNPLKLTLPSSSTAGGGTVTLDGAYVRYAPKPAFIGLDSFQYSIDNGHGGTTTGTVTVVVRDNSHQQSPNIVSIQFTGGGAAITFIGIPGRIYEVQYSDSLDTPNWRPFAGESRPTAGPNGIYQYFDSNTAGAQTRYYRAVQVQ